MEELEINIDEQIAKDMPIDAYLNDDNFDVFVCVSVDETEYLNGVPESFGKYTCVYVFNVDECILLSGIPIYGFFEKHLTDEEYDEYFDLIYPCQTEYLNLHRSIVLEKAEHFEVVNAHEEYFESDFYPSFREQYQ